ncbi:sensor histidine kinase [Paenibacillus antarcticus]|uniref:Two-component sensor histidine kinase n=1 Tax=Paenibacillus antarcticus TaxID=253703 RepID=A0A168QMP1_9BACL|nr:sensor histidine kinase [Paenibacillus antarcticus]OAB47966.1 two-component sensor histidine kinase [Paenibacillus antarcticus]
MTIRKKLLLFIPLLVLLVNSVTFFLFESGKTVQQSYDIMMERILLYKQSSQSADLTLRLLYREMIHTEGSNVKELEQEQNNLENIRSALSGMTSPSLSPSAMTSYVHMLETFMEQMEASIVASEAQTPRIAFAHYEDAEQTTGFIRAEAQILVDAEINFYQPIYREIQQENIRMNVLSSAIFVINTLLSIVLAYWISRSITMPVSQLVGMARRISKGDLHVQPLTIRSHDELGILSGAFEQMTNDLLVFIEKDKANIEQEKFLKELELQALQNQMNPHFLFNTLNVLSRLALLEGAEKTSDLIVSMSNLLRYNLRNLDQPVTLQDEVSIVQEYFTIQQARFRDRISFELEIDESTLDVVIPALTLQPIVENSFMHGIQGMEQGALIRLKIGKVPEGVIVILSDNGIGMSEITRQSLLRMEAGQQKEHSTGLGTRNVFKRLKLFYGQEDLVNIESAPDEGTTIKILIPIRKEEEPLHVPDIDRR